MHSFANLLTKKDQAQKLAFTKSMPFFFVLKSVSSIHYLTVLTTSICFFFFCMFVCSTHWVGYVHNIFKLYTAPYKEKKNKKQKEKDRQLKKHHFKWGTTKVGAQGPTQRPLKSAGVFLPTPPGVGSGPLECKGIPICSDLNMRHLSCLQTTDMQTSSKL